MNNLLFHKLIEIIEKPNYNKHINYCDALKTIKSSTVTAITNLTKHWKIIS